MSPHCSAYKAIDGGENPDPRDLWKNIQPSRGHTVKRTHRSSPTHQETTRFLPRSLPPSAKRSLPRILNPTASLITPGLQTVKSSNRPSVVKSRLQENRPLRGIRTRGTGLSGNSFRKRSQTTEEQSRLLNQDTHTHNTGLHPSYHADEKVQVSTCRFSRETRPCPVDPVDCRRGDLAVLPVSCTSSLFCSLERRVSASFFHWSACRFATRTCHVATQEGGRLLTWGETWARSEALQTHCT